MPGKRGDVDISGDVNFDKAGSYTVDYRFTPEDGVTGDNEISSSSGGSVKMEKTTGQTLENYKIEPFTHDT